MSELIMFFKYKTFSTLGTNSFLSNPKTELSHSACLSRNLRQYPKPSATVQPQ